MTLAIALLVMVALGMFWYWQGIPKQVPEKKNAPADAAKGRAPVKKSAPAQAPANSTDGRDDAHKYRAVSIHHRADACAAAKALADKRFLTDAAPTLPLSGCNCAHCQCSYAHHADQRSEDDDRRTMHSLQTELYTRTAKERREHSGRRRDDVG